MQRLRQALGEGGFGEITDQGLVLKRTRWEGTPALVVGGGSPRATLWAVYELVERWGVRYLTDRDALPQERREFQVPDLDVLMEPVFRIRAHPTLQDFAPSGEAWGMADFRVLIDQLAKAEVHPDERLPIRIPTLSPVGAQGHPAKVRLPLVRTTLSHHPGHDREGAVRRRCRVLESGSSSGGQLRRVDGCRRAAGPQPDRVRSPAGDGVRHLRTGRSISPRNSRPC